MSSEYQVHWWVVFKRPHVPLEGLFFNSLHMLPDQLSKLDQVLYSEKVTKKLKICQKNIFPAQFQCLFMRQYLLFAQCLQHPSSCSLSIVPCANRNDFQPPPRIPSQILSCAVDKKKTLKTDKNRM